MFSSPRLSRTTIDRCLFEEKCRTIEQLKGIIEQMKIQHEKKEHDLIKHIGMLYNDLQLNKKKMAHLILKYQKQKKKSDENLKISKDFATQTEEILSSSHYDQTNSSKQPIEQYPKYYTLQTNTDHLQYISATPQLPLSDHSFSSSTIDRKHHESSSSAYNTADSLPSSTYSDELQSLERLLNAAGTMYTTETNLQHTIQLQEELFRQQLRLRGIDLNCKNEQDGTASEHFYDNIDSETSDFEKQTIAFRNRSLEKKQRMVRFSLHQDEQNKVKNNSSKNMKFHDQYYSLGKRKPTKKSSYQHTNIPARKLLSPSNMLTVTIT